MVKVGIIGCGKIAQVRHIPEYLDNPNAKLTGLYDLNLQRAKDLAEKYNCKSYESVEEMLADPEIDAVSVCVANHVHALTTNGLTWSGMMNVFRHSAVIGIIGLGMGLICITGEIDLSVGSMLALDGGFSVIIFNIIYSKNSPSSTGGR